MGSIEFELCMKLAWEIFYRDKDVGEASAEDFIAECRIHAYRLKQEDMETLQTKEQLQCQD